MTTPVFIKIEKYNELLDLLKKVENNVSQSSKTLDSLRKLKEDEEEKINDWESNLKLINEKLENIKILFHDS